MHCCVDTQNALVKNVPSIIPFFLRHATFLCFIFVTWNAAERWNYVHYHITSEGLRLGLYMSNPGWAVVIGNKAAAHCRKSLYFALTCSNYIHLKSLQLIIMPFFIILPCNAYSKCRGFTSLISNTSCARFLIKSVPPPIPAVAFKVSAWLELS